MNLPRLAKLLVGRGIWERFAEELPNGEVEFFADLALYANAGIQVILAESEDWPPTAIIGEDDKGRRYLLQE
jgi:hypothetical protein